MSSELANTKAENAKLLAQYEAELQKAKGSQSKVTNQMRMKLLVFAENAKAQSDMSWVKAT